MLFLIDADTARVKCCAPTQRLGFGHADARCRAEPPTCSVPSPETPQAAGQWVSSSSLHPSASETPLSHAQGPIPFPNIKKKTKRGAPQVRCQAASEPHAHRNIQTPAGPHCVHNIVRKARSNPSSSGSQLLAATRVRAFLPQSVILHYLCFSPAP